MSKWFSEDGLMRGELTDDADPYPGHTLRRVRNENGIYFHALWIMLLDQKKLLTLDDQSSFVAAADRLRIRPGEFARHPGNMVSREAHDNYAGIAVGGLLCGTMRFAIEICEHGERTGWKFNHLDQPGSKAYDLRQVRQGSEVAFYKILAGRIPAVWELLWLCLALLVTPWKSDMSSTMLTYLRIRGIIRALKDEQMQTEVNAPATDRIPLPPLMWFPLLVSMGVWSLVTYFRWGKFPKITGKYFSSIHPINRIQNEGLRVET